MIGRNRGNVRQKGLTRGMGTNLHHTSGSTGRPKSEEGELVVVRAAIPRSPNGKFDRAMLCKELATWACVR